MSEQEGTAAAIAVAAMIAGTRAEQAPAAPEPAAPEEPAQDFPSGLFGKDARNRALIQALHGPLDEPAPASDDGPPDFDGGAREPAPGSSDPEVEHNQLIGDLFRNAPSGGGGRW